MRLHLLTAAVLIAGGPAMASSIEPVTSMVKADSIIVKSCSDCPAMKVDPVKRTYVVPQLAEGTQKTEIRDVDGQRKVIRTEAWMGGSPVIFVSKAPEEKTAVTTTQTDQALPIAAVTDPVPAAIDGIDKSAKTSALSAEEPAVAAVAGDVITPSTLDTSKFDLRLQQ